MKEISNLLTIVLTLVLFSSCERIPDWEKKSVFSRSVEDTRRLSELRHWIFSCRGSLLSASSEKIIGDEIESFLDGFRKNGLSSLETTSSKVLIGTALLWNDSGLLITPAPAMLATQGIECASATTGWLPASVVGVDHALQIGVLKVSLPPSAHLKNSGKWVARSDPVTADDDISILSAPIQGSLDRMRVSLELFRPNLHTGLDENLLLFLPPPTIANVGGILVDQKWRLLGYLFPTTVASPWGTAIDIQRAGEIVSSIQTHGSVQRAFVGFGLRFSTELGFQIEQIEVNGPAYRAGLRPEDILTRWNGKDLKEFGDWAEVSAAQIGKTIPVVIKRADKLIEARIIPEARE